MIGTAMVNGKINPNHLSEAIPGEALDSRLSMGAGALYLPTRTLQGRNDWDTKGIFASLDNGGRGLLRVSNKESEHNLLNIPWVLVSINFPGTQRPMQSRRVLSYPIPNMSIPNSSVNLG